MERAKRCACPGREIEKKSGIRLDGQRASPGNCFNMTREQDEAAPGHVPVFNVPNVVMALALTMAAIHGLMVWGPLDPHPILLLFAFLPTRELLDASLAHVPPWVSEGAKWWSYVTYALLHADWVHLAINVFFMLAFGTVVARRLGAVRFLLLSAAGAAAGALTYLVLHADEFAVLVGASAAVSAQMAGASRLMFARPGALRNMAERDIRSLPALSLREMLGNRSALAFIATWILANVVFGLTGIGTEDSQGQVAWEAHLGGFAAGLGLFTLFDRRNAPRVF
jgi:membrane associated rhomboid family serine protease